MAKTKMRKPLSWDAFFMSCASLASLRSKDPSSQVGCALVKNKRVIGLGYNGFPRGIGDGDLPWGKGDSSTPFENTKYPYINHAEENALGNTIESPIGSTAYVSMHPCNVCAPKLLSNGIEEIVYNSTKYQNTPSFAISQDFLTTARIPVRRFSTSQKVMLNLLFGNENLKPFDRTKGRSHNPEENPSFISWDSYFMGLAVLASLKSKDPLHQEGSCLVSSDLDKRVLSMGYNGLPSMFSDSTFDWDLALGDPKREIVVSSLTNALKNVSSRLPEAVLYTTHLPRHADMRFGLTNGIKKVIYGYETKSDSEIATKKMCDLAGVEVKPFIPSTPFISLDLTGEESYCCNHNPRY